MDLHSFIENLRALIAAVRVNDWALALKIGIELIPVVLDAWSGPKPMLAGVETRSTQELCTELERCCSQTFGQSDMEAPKGPFIDMVWPMLKALLVKILSNL